MMSLMFYVVFMMLVRLVWAIVFTMFVRFVAFMMLMVLVMELLRPANVLMLFRLCFGNGLGLRWLCHSCVSCFCTSAKV